MKRWTLSPSAEALIAGERLFVWGSPEPMGAPEPRRGSPGHWARSPAIKVLMSGEHLRAECTRSREDPREDPEDRRGKGRP